MHHHAIALPLTNSIEQVLGKLAILVFEFFLGKATMPRALFNIFPLCIRILRDSAPIARR
jgi:hypothetical protein